MSPETKKKTVLFGCPEPKNRRTKRGGGGMKKGIQKTSTTAWGGGLGPRRTVDGGQKTTSERIRRGRETTRCGPREGREKTREWETGLIPSPLKCQRERRTLKISVADAPLKPAVILRRYRRYKRHVLNAAVARAKFVSARRKMLHSKTPAANSWAKIIDEYI